MNLVDIVNDIYREDYIRSGSKYYEISGTGSTYIYNDFIATLLSHKNTNTVIIQESDLFNIDHSLYNQIYDILVKGRDVVVYNDYRDSIINESLEMITKDVHDYKSIYLIKTKIYTLLAQYFVVSKDVINKIIYYGKHTQTVEHLLNIIFKLNNDIVCLLPYGKEAHSTLLSSKNTIHLLVDDSAVSLLDRENLGNAIDYKTSGSSVIVSEVNAELFSGTGMVAKWETRGSYVKGIPLLGTFGDIDTFYSEPINMRPGFKLDGNVIVAPVLFKLIKGCTRDTALKYIESIKDNLTFYSDNQFITNITVNDEKLSIFRRFIESGKIDISGLKARGLYTLERYSVDIQELILYSIKNFYSNNILTNDITFDDLDKISYLIFNMNPSIINMLYDFDYSGNNPKIVLTIGQFDELNDIISILLGYLTTIGFDVIIFDYSMNVSLDKYINNNYYDTVRFEEKVETNDSTLSSFFNFFKKR